MLDWRLQTNGAGARWPGGDHREQPAPLRLMKRQDRDPPACATIKAIAHCAQECPIDAIDDAAERLAQAWLDRSNSNLPEHDARHFQERQDIVKCQRRLNIGDGILRRALLYSRFPPFCDIVALRAARGKWNECFHCGRGALRRNATRAIGDADSSDATDLSKAWLSGGLSGGARPALEATSAGML